MMRNPKPTKNRLVAAALSLIIPGSGQAYLGQVWKGLAIILVLYLSLQIHLVLLLVIYILNIADAVIMSERINQKGSIGSWEFMWSRSHPTNRTGDFEIYNIILTKQSEQFIGTEQRTIDNSKSSSEVMRNIRIGKEYSKSYNIEYEHINTRTTGFEFSTKLIPGIRQVTETTLRNRFSTSEQTTLRHEEEFGLPIPPNKKIRVSFHWKQIKQEGVLFLRDQLRNELEVPFSVITGITFDTQIDEIQ